MNSKTLRTKKIDTRFTEDEYNVILEMERTLGLSKTELVRARLLNDSTNLVINAKELIRGLDAIGAELGRSGNNINQLARHANLLKKKGRLDPRVIEQFNVLFAGYLDNRAQLETALRKIIKAARA